MIANEKRNENTFSHYHLIIAVEHMFMQFSAFLHLFHVYFNDNHPGAGTVAIALWSSTI